VKAEEREYISPAWLGFGVKYNVPVAPLCGLHKFLGWNMFISLSESQRGRSLEKTRCVARVP
jgi:hypothetical protein